VAIGTYAGTNAAPANGMIVSGNVAIGNDAPASTLDVTGSFGTGFSSSSGIKAGSVSMDATATTWRYTSTTGADQITLPAANTCANRMYIILNQTGSTLSISQNYYNLSNTKVTSGTTFMTTGTSLWIQGDGTNWYQIK
jgi:hypothetical protein